MGVFKKFSLFRKSSKATAVEVIETPEIEDSHGLPDGTAFPAQQLDVGPEPVSPAPGPRVASPPLPPPTKSPSPGVPLSRRQVGAAAASQLTPTAEDDDEIEFVADLPTRGQAAIAAASRPALPTVTFQVSETAPAKEQLPNFEVDLAQVYTGVNEAFGSVIAASLQSSKWDKRAQALKALSTALKGQDIQGMAKPGSTGILGKGRNNAERAKSWKVCAQLLHHFLNDKVMPVRLAAYDLFADTFTNVLGIPKHEVHGALQTLMGRLLFGLGDSNCRVHEGARKNVLLAAEGHNLLGLGAVLALLKAKLDEQQVVHGKTSVSSGRITTASKGTNDRAKIIFGVLDCVNLMLHHFPGRRASDEAEEDDEADEDSWTQNCIAPFVVAGMDDSLGLRVRGSVLDLAVTAYQTLGGEAMEPVLAQLRPAKQQLLKQRFQESEEDDGEDSIEIIDGQRGPLPEGRPKTGGAFADLVICGVGAKSGQSSQSCPLLPGCLLEGEDEDNEDFLMDGILEETGAAFSSTGMMMHELAQARRREMEAPMAGRMREEDYDFLMTEGNEEDDDDDSRPLLAGIGGPQRAMVNELLTLEQDHWLLENQLMNMGVDIDEQEALLSSLQDNGAQEQAVHRSKGQDDEVAVLLNSLQGDLSLSLMGAVEAC